jgi:hypothetical protein
MTNVVQFRLAKVEAQLEEPETPRERRIRQQQEPPPVSETGKNHRLRQLRYDHWRDADMETRYWRAKMKFADACDFAGRHGLDDALQYEFPEHMELVTAWRQAYVRQLLTPAPTVGAGVWKRSAFAQGQHRHIGIKPGPIEQAIADDVAWLAAHPVRQSRSGASS